MNICLVSREYPPETGWGGIGTYTYNLAHAVSELGHNVHVIAFAPFQEMEYQDKKVFVHRIKSKEPRGFWRLNSYFPFSVLFYSIRVAQKIKELISKYQIEIVEAPEWKAEVFWYLFKKKVPVVLRFHTPNMLTQKLNSRLGTLADKIINRMEKYCASHSDYLTSPSRALADIVIKEFSLAKEAVEIIPNPLDINEFKPKGEANHNLNILYVGRLERRKGVHILAQAIPLVLSKIPEVKFVFIGKDSHNYPEISSMRKYIIKYANNQDNVVFIEHLSREKLPAYYQGSSICIIPSIWEAFGYTCIEAMACGKTVIASNAGGLSEILDNGKNGILIKAESPVLLAEAILQLLSNSSRRIELGMAARQTVEQKFASGVIAKKMVAIYKNIVEP